MGINFTNGLYSGYTADSISSVYASADAAQAKSSVTRAAQAIRAMQDQLAKSQLVNQAMWELMSKKMGFTEQQLMAKMSEIDLRDGVEDGKVTAKAQKCPACGHMVSKRHKTCIYCGHQIEKSPFAV